MARPYGCRGERLPPLGPLAPDLTRSTTFAGKSAEEVRALAAGEVAGEFYPRYGHPNGRRLEARMAELEGADGAVAFASGMAALHAVFCGLLGSGDVVAAARDLYGGTLGLLKHDLPRLGIEVRPFDPFSAQEIATALRAPTKLVHVETPTNPLSRVVDVERIVAAARECGALVCVDATFLPPPLQQPLRHGADLSMHSATKFLGGHSDVLGGVVSGRHELMERLEAFRRRTGGVLGPQTAWLLERSLATLELRARRASETARRLAGFLAESGLVLRVHYPGLPDHPDAAVCARQMKCPGSVLAFDVAGGLEAAAAVYDRFRVIARAVSLGGVETVALLPLHTSHPQSTAEERAAVGISDGTIRLSVGLEPYEELERDLAQALGS
jgi:methionine-gamma-lyase